MIDSAIVELPSQTQFIERLVTLTRFSSHFIFVHGGHGSGKTLLAQGILDQVNYANQAWLDAQSENALSTLRELLIKQWISDPLFNADDPLWESLSRNFETPDTGLLLVIDNAELLPAQFCTELFELIENYSETYHYSLNVILFSAVSFRLLAHEQHWQLSDVLELDIEPLDDYESSILAKQLFVRANCQLSAANKRAIEHRIAKAEGHPQAICNVVEHTISGVGIMSEEEQSTPRKPFLIWGIIAVLFAAVAGLAVQLWQGDQMDTQSPSAAAQTGQANVDIPVVLPTEQDNKKQATPEPSATQASPSAVVNKPSTTKSSGNAQSDQTSTLPKPVTGETIEQKAEPKVGQKRVVVDDKVVDEIMKAQDGQQASSTDDDSQPVTQKDDSAPSAASDETSQKSTHATPASDNASESDKQATTQSSENAPSDQAQSSQGVTPDQGRDTTSVLMNKPAGHYTLQLGAFSSMAAANEFVHQSGYQPAWVYPFQGSRQILYKVITGDFASRSAAIQQTRKLKEKGQVSLVKSFKQVQFELKQ